MTHKMINVQRAAIAFVTAILGVATTQHGTANPLDSLIESKTMQRFENRQAGSGRLAPPSRSKDAYLRGIDPTSNFATLWREPTGGLELLNWAGAKLPHYRSHKPRSSRKDELVLGEIDLLDNKRATATVTVVVPHPSMAPLVEANVLPELRVYRPPVLKVVSEKKIPVTEGSGTLYETEKGTCVIVILLAQQSLINIAMPDCKNTDMLIDIAKSLDIPRLNRKLNS